MKAREILNKRYAQLCESLGDLEMNRMKIEERMSAVKKDILAIEAALPLAQQIESEVRRELSPPEPGTSNE